MLYACGVNESGTRSIGDTQNVLFTEDDIEWFNVTTRELRFCDTMAPLKMNKSRCLQASISILVANISFQVGHPCRSHL